MSSFLHLPVIHAHPEGPTDALDPVATEEPLEILVNGRNLAITMRTPGHDEELAAGFLFTEGLIRSGSGIRSITGVGNRVSFELTDPSEAIFNRQDRRFAMTSACGVCGKASIDSIFASDCALLPTGTFVVEAEILHDLPALLRKAQTVFDQTGGLHAAALFDADGNLGLIREDVGRHNAVDKVIGAVVLERDSARLPLHNRLLLVSGRASFELVQKAAMAGIPVLAAVGAPSTLAVETAQRFGMTLVGFLRHDRFNIYSRGERIRTLGAPLRSTLPPPGNPLHVTLK